jgi:hypothetical protein
MRMLTPTVAAALTPRHEQLYARDRVRRRRHDHFVALRRIAADLGSEARHTREA